MFKRRVILGLVVCLLALLIVGQTLSQPAQRGQTGGQRSGQRGAQRGDAQGSVRPQTQRRQFDPQQMQRMMAQRLQRQLRASDAEWKTLGPVVMKVSQLNRQVTGGGMGRTFFGDRQNTAGSQLSEVDKSTQQLRTLLNNESAKPEDIEKQLTAYRAAREKAKKQLIAEQQNLQKQVTVRQKAQLVLMGLLD